MQRLMYGTWGVDLEEFTPRPDGREPAWGSDPVLLFVGRIHPEKGIEDLLEAFGKVINNQPAARLVLIGDGPQRPAAEAQVQQRGWRERVQFLGTIKNRDLPPYLRAATVFVAPSVRTPRWEEYVGMTNLQALACGTPVVTTRSGAIPEYVPETAGYLVPEHDPPALAEAILKLLADHDLCRRMGAAGREHVSQCCDALKNVLQAEAEILQLVQPGRGD
jgi:glycosyltransferase involved in cell wall biosynthesis